VLHQPVLGGALNLLAAFSVLQVALALALATVVVTIEAGQVVGPQLLQFVDQFWLDEYSAACWLRWHDGSPANAHERPC
jgi:hypothetical protein